MRPSGVRIHAQYGRQSNSPAARYAFAELPPFGQLHQSHLCPGQPRPTLQARGDPLIQASHPILHFKGMLNVLLQTSVYIVRCFLLPIPLRAVASNLFIFIHAELVSSLRVSAPLLSQPTTSRLARSPPLKLLHSNSRYSLLHPPAPPHEIFLLPNPHQALAQLSTHFSSPT